MGRRRRRRRHTPQANPRSASSRDSVGDSSQFTSASRSPARNSGVAIAATPSTWQTIIELRITNTGRTLARDVRFEFDPPLASSHDDGGGRGPLMELNIFKHGIPSLAPGKEITIFFDQYPSRAEKKLPMTYSARVAYTDTTGKQYSDPLTLDLQMYLGTGGVTRHGMHDIHKQLKVIADTVKKWTDYSGVKVMTRADIKERNAEWQAEHLERQAAADAEDEAEVAATSSRTARDSAD